MCDQPFDMHAIDMEARIRHVEQVNKELKQENKELGDKMQDLIDYQYVQSLQIESQGQAIEWLRANQQSELMRAQQRNNENMQNMQQELLQLINNFKNEIQQWKLHEK